ncbi:MAG TPA: hypothetical protein VNX28_16225, partial [Gemmataceae bacterium]|nr:hypothetical protein [Gemmataceae bacterium]
PEAVLEICEEIIRRGLKVKLTGQLRIHKKCDLAYFKKLRQAGFVALRFGIDAFSENALRLQKKGYTTATVCQNLKDCWEAGIYSEVNWVIGVPGETETDIDESIALILQNKPYIGRLANINPLILVTGGVYWMEPEKHNIHFRGVKEDLYRTHPRAIPAHLWYSTEPYIDEKVRKQRFERIVLALHDGDFNVGVWANRVIDDVKYHRDPNRAGPKEDSDTKIGDAIEKSPAGEGPRRGKMSAGVGGMEKPAAPAKGTLEFNADARSSSYVFRAGSSLPEDKTYYFRSHLYVVTFKGELFGIEPPALEPIFGTGAVSLERASGATLDVRQKFAVTLAKTKAALPDLIQAVGAYNIVYYDSLYYGVPQNFDPVLSHLILQRLWNNGSNPKALKRPYLVRLLRRAARNLLHWVMRKLPGQRGIAPVSSIPWGDVDLEGLPGVIVGTDVTRVVAEVEKLLGLDRSIGKPAALEVQCPAPAFPSLPTIEVPPAGAEGKPHRVGSLEGYNIVEYEGWFYGLPAALGDIRLDEVDVIEMPGVIRDVSREVVEGEIRELLTHQPNQELHR